jgi:hypothetical protein
VQRGRGDTTLSALCQHAGASQVPRGATARESRENSRSNFDPNGWNFEPIGDVAGAFCRELAAKLIYRKVALRRLRYAARGNRAAAMAKRSGTRFAPRTPDAALDPENKLKRNTGSRLIRSRFSSGCVQKPSEG